LRSFFIDLDFYGGEMVGERNDGTAYLRALMHDDGNIRYANYQSEEQMSDYLTAQGHTEIISDIV